MTTDTTEQGLEHLICTALAGHPCDPPAASAVDEPAAGYGGSGWICGSHRDYDREYCVDLVQLSAFLRATQPETADSLALGEAGPARRKLLARLQGEISKRVHVRDAMDGAVRISVRGRAFNTICRNYGGIIFDLHIGTSG